ncbi:MAG TPA: serine/threonine-protein kinase, partial [Chroococcales cyanobacterium]
MKLCLRCNQYFEDGIDLCPIDTSLLESVGEHPLIGALINDRYVVDSVIGKGSSGIVYKATRLLMGREVAVKVLHSYLGADTGSLDRFLREAKAAGRLKHPHIINIWESGVTDDAQPYFVMDYLEGVTLADLIREKGYIHGARVLAIMRQVCDALAEAHRQGIVHRDIKPENIVLQANEGDFDDFVKVLDFGIADQPTGQEQHQRQKTAAGSPAYMSPEQCQGFRLDHRSDIYSLGIVVFELLTGQRPFNSDDVMSLFKMHVAKRPPSLATVRPDLSFSPQLDTVLGKALGKKPDDRHQTVTEFFKELEEALSNTDAPGKKKSEHAADRFAVPEGDRLVVSTGQQKFMPGPEEMMEMGEESASEPARQKTTAPQSQEDSSAGNKDPEVSAAVNRLLKSAKRTAEAFRTSADPLSVSNWARDVLTRPTESGQNAVEQDPTNQPQGESEKAKPAAPSQAGGPRVGDKPDVSKWAQQVLNRGDEKDSAAKA